MKLSSIKVGEWYETKSGVGKALRVGGCFPVAVKFEIVAPYPRGVVYVDPRDVVRQLAASEIPPAGGAP